jgi:hypothetical protein
MRPRPPRHIPNTLRTGGQFKRTARRAPRCFIRIRPSRLPPRVHRLTGRYRARLATAPISPRRVHPPMRVATPSPPTQHRWSRDESTPSNRARRPSTTVDAANPSPTHAGPRPADALHIQAFATLESLSLGSMRRPFRPHGAVLPALHQRRSILQIDLMRCTALRGSPRTKEPSLQVHLDGQREPLA